MIKAIIFYRIVGDTIFGDIFEDKGGRKGMCPMQYVKPFECFFKQLCQNGLIFNLFIYFFEEMLNFERKSMCIRF